MNKKSKESIVSLLKRMVEAQERITELLEQLITAWIESIKTAQPKQTEGES